MNSTSIKPLTFTRFFAAIWVVIFHYLAYNNISFFKNPAYSNFLKQGNIAVLYFFVLSGFIMTYVYSGKEINYSQFLKKRFARIYPMYCVALIASCLLTKKYFDSETILANFFALQIFNLEKFNLINEPSWTIGQEIIFYLLFPFIIPIISQNSILKNVLLLILLILIGSFLHFDFFGSLFHKTHVIIYQLQPFLYGVIVGVLYKNPKVFNYFKYKKPIANLNMFFLAFSIIIFFVLINNFSVNLFNGLPILALLSSSIIFFLALLDESNWVYKLLSTPFLILLGEISYSLYILQHPFRLFFGNFIKLGSFRYELLFLILLVFTSWLFYQYVETPLRIYFSKSRKL